MKTYAQIYLEQIVKWSELVTPERPLDRFWCVGWIGKSEKMNYWS